MTDGGIPRGAGVHLGDSYLTINISVTEMRLPPAEKLISFIKTTGKENVASQLTWQQREEACCDVFQPWLRNDRGDRSILMMDIYFESIFFLIVGAKKSKLPSSQPLRLRQDLQLLFCDVVIHLFSFFFLFWSAGPKMMTTSSAFGNCRWHLMTFL